MSDRTLWKDHEIETLRRLWDKLPLAGIAKEIGRSEKAVSHKAHKLGLPGKAAGGWNKAKMKERPLPEAKPDPTAEQIIAARARMKSLPGPFVKGWRMSARSFR